MAEIIASTEQHAHDSMEGNVAAYRDFDKPSGDVSLYDEMRMEFQIWGGSDRDARFLVKTWKQR